MDRKMIGGFLVSFIIFLLLAIINFFLNIELFAHIIYSLFSINLLILLILFTKKSIKKNKVHEEERLYERITKGSICLIPLVILSYIFWINFNPLSQTIIYDIGEEDQNILSPIERISAPIIDKGISYRVINEPLIYFNTPITTSTKEIKIQIKLRGNSIDHPVRLGAKSESRWNYISQIIYDETLNNQKIYSEDNYPKNFEDNSVVYIDPIIKDINLNIPENRLEEYSPKKIAIDKRLRGSHTILIYIKGNFNFTIFKEDINTYEGIDELRIKLYKEDKLIKEVTIPDDGITDSSNIKGIEQIASLIEDNLEEGVYRVEILDENGDVVIKKIISNQDRLIFKGKLFILDPTKIYLKNYKDKNIFFSTPHKTSLQTINVNGKNIKIEQRDKLFKTEILPKEEYVISIPRGNVIIESDNYFSFSKDSFFIPQKFFISNNPYSADYIISNYKEVERLDGGWIIVETKFNLEDLYIENNEIIFMLNQEKNKLQIDWIKIKLIK